MTSEDTLKQLAIEAVYSPQEKLAPVERKHQNLFIGIPKEVSFQEKRVPLTPKSVALLVNRGHEIFIESQSGIEASFQDRDYSEAGAQIVYSKEEVYKADIILKVEPPTKEELDLLKPGKVLISALQMSTQSKEHIKTLMRKKVTAIAWDYVMDSSNQYTIVRSMAEIAGSTSVLIASELLANSNNGPGVLLGGLPGVKPTEVVIIGAGTVGQMAARSAIGLGATVKVFDDNIFRLRRLQEKIDGRIYTSVLQPDILEDELKRADVAIGALRPVNGRTPCVVSENMVSKMKHGAVIVDVSIDRGGVFETSEMTYHDNPTYKKFGVTHYCVPNIASRVSKTASIALSNIFTPMLLSVSKRGGINGMIKQDVGFRKGVYVFKGALSNRALGEAFDLPFKDLDLMAPAF